MRADATIRSLRTRHRTAGTSAVGQVNRTVIVELLRDHGPMSRMELAELSGLSQATVNRLVASLVRDGVAAWDVHGPSTGGRPPQLVRYHATSESVLALDVGGTKIGGAVADLAGAIVHRVTRETNPARAGEDRDPIERVLAVTAELLAASTRMGMTPRALALGVPGVVRPDGTVMYSPAVGWDGRAIGHEVEERLGIPTIVENDVNLFALGEQRRGVGRGTKDMAAIAVGTAIGGAIVIDGRLLRGAHASAGELGYMITSPGSLLQPYPDFGDFEGRAGGRAVAMRAAAWARDGNEAITTRQVFRLAEEGDDRAAGLVEDVVGLIAQAIANVAVVVDPELVVLGGGVSRSIVAYLPRIRGLLEGRIPEVPRIELASLGTDAVLIGAAELAIERTAGFAYLHSLAP